jgi:hypothetical protein
MSDPLFRNYERLVEISILGTKFKVPEKNTFLRAFQFVSPETIPYGRFCWNQECQLCRIGCRLAAQPGDQTRHLLACKVIVGDGLEVTELSDELKWTLAGILKASESPPRSE